LDSGAPGGWSFDESLLSSSLLFPYLYSCTSVLPYFRNCTPYSVILAFVPSFLPSESASQPASQPNSFSPSPSPDLPTLPTYVAARLQNPIPILHLTAFPISPHRAFLLPPSKPLQRAIFSLQQLRSTFPVSCCLPPALCLSIELFTVRRRASVRADVCGQNPAPSV
jgi:hypothetical protein